MSQRPARIHVAPKSMDYFRMLCDSSTFRDAGVPIGDPVPSLKSHCFSRGTFACGTQGVGFVYFGPWNAGTSDTTCGLYSGPSFTGVAFTNIGTPPALVAVNTNAPYLAADIGPAPLAQWRLVSAMLRIRYTGTTLNLGGTVHGLFHPEQESLTGITIPGLDLYKQTARMSVSRDWQTINFCPSTQDGGYTEAADNAALGRPYFMGFIVNSTPSNTFDFEFYVNVEYAGRNIRGQTPGTNDPVAYFAAAEAMRVAPVHDKALPKYTAQMENSFENLIKEGTTYVASGLAKAAVGAAVSALV